MFDHKGLMLIAYGGAGNTVFKYNTEDTVAEVEKDGYFKSGNLRSGDIVFVGAKDGFSSYEILDVSNRFVVRRNGSKSLDAKSRIEASEKAAKEKGTAKK